MFIVLKSFTTGTITSSKGKVIEIKDKNISDMLIKSGVIAVYSKKEQTLAEKDKAINALISEKEEMQTVINNLTAENDELRTKLGELTPDLDSDSEKNNDNDLDNNKDNPDDGDNE